MHAAAAALHAEARATHARDGDRRADFETTTPWPSGATEDSTLRCTRTTESVRPVPSNCRMRESSTEPSAGSVSLEPSASSSVTKPLGAVTTVLPSGRLAPGASVLPAAEAWPLMCTTRASAGRTGIMDSGMCNSRPIGSCSGATILFSDCSGFQLAELRVYVLAMLISVSPARTR